jgi:hypothetical protein
MRQPMTLSKRGERFGLVVCRNLQHKACVRAVLHFLAGLLTG